MADPILENHGTRLSQLKPSSIWGAAMEDLKRRENNRHDGGGPVGKFQHYAFHRDHVRKAEAANDIIRAALADPEKGRQSSKFHTRLIYADLELLRQALR